MTKRPGISDTTLASAGVRFTDFPEPGSIEIPYFDAAGQPTGFSRWRLPRPKPDGQKYYQQPNTGVHVYFPPGGVKPSGRLILTEGEFKSLSLAESGYETIGLTGLYTYTRTQAGIATLLPGIQIAVAKSGAGEVFL